MWGLIVFIMGGYVFIQGLINLKRTNNFIRKSHLIKGRVIDIKKENRNIRTTKIQSFIPIIEYVDKRNGSVKTFEPNFGFVEGKYRVGDTLDIWYYSEGDETELIIKSGFTKWNGIIVAIVGFAFCTSVGLWFFLSN